MEVRTHLPVWDSLYSYSKPLQVVSRIYLLWCLRKIICERKLLPNLFEGIVSHFIGSRNTKFIGIGALYAIYIDNYIVIVVIIRNLQNAKLIGFIHWRSNNIFNEVEDMWLMCSCLFCIWSLGILCNHLRCISKIIEYTCSLILVCSNLVYLSFYGNGHVILQVILLTNSFSDYKYYRSTEILKQLQWCAVTSARDGCIANVMASGFSFPCFLLNPCPFFLLVWYWLL